MTEPVKIEQLDGGTVVRLTLAQPERRNAMSAELMSALAQGIKTAKDGGARAIVLAAEGPVFCAGADLAGLRHLSSEEERKRQLPAHLERISLLTRETLSLLIAPGVISIAALNGPAVGAGCLMALCCDFRFSVPDASFWFPEVRYGRAGYLAAMRIMTAHLGTAMTKRMLLAEERVSADTMMHHGVVTALCSPRDLVEQATTLARKISAYDPATVSRMKSYIHQSALDQLHWDERSES